MNIPPILEKLLLSNEAVYKNASLGIGGANMVFVPEGKTAVLLEFSIEPFVNDITNVVTKMLENGNSTDVLDPSTYTTIFNTLKNRLCYQIQIINDSFSTYFSFRDSFSIVNNTGYTDINDIYASVNLSFAGKREELFIYTDRSMYFNFIYPFQLSGGAVPGITPTYTTPTLGFLPKIQNLPKTPITFNQNGLVDFVQKATIATPALDSFYPVNYQINGAVNPQMEYLRFFNGLGPTTIEQPLTSGTELQFQNLFQIPFINVKYVLINKRASDYGITAPKV